MGGVENGVGPMEYRREVSWVPGAAAARKCMVGGGPGGAVFVVAVAYWLVGGTVVER